MSKLEKIYRGTRITNTTIVTVDGQPLPLRLDLLNHSPTGFEWGYGGSGPAQLALAILADCLDDTQALRLHQTFKWMVIAKLPHDEWQISAMEVCEALDVIAQEDNKANPIRL